MNSHGAPTSILRSQEKQLSAAKEQASTGNRSSSGVPGKQNTISKPEIPANPWATAPSPWTPRRSDDRKGSPQLWTPPQSASTAKTLSAEGARTFSLWDEPSPLSSTVPWSKTPGPTPTRKVPPRSVFQQQPQLQPTQAKQTDFLEMHEVAAALVADQDHELKRNMEEHSKQILNSVLAESPTMSAKESSALESSSSSSSLKQPSTLTTRYLCILGVPTAPPETTRAFVQFFQKLGDLVSVRHALFRGQRAIVLNFFDVRQCARAKEKLQNNYGTASLVTYFCSPADFGLTEENPDTILVAGLESVQEQVPAAMVVETIFQRFGDVWKAEKARESWKVCFFDTRDAAFAQQNLDNIFFKGNLLTAKLAQVKSERQEDAQSLLDQAFVELFVQRQQQIQRWQEQEQQQQQASMAEHRRLASHKKPKELLETDRGAARFVYPFAADITGVSPPTSDPEYRTSVNAIWEAPLKPPQRLSATGMPTSAGMSRYSTGAMSATSSGSLDRGLVPNTNQVDLSLLEQGVERRTTIMFKNLPNKLTQQMLLELLDETHRGEYDFVYLRMDFKNRCNVGYAFINFIHPKSIASFAQRVVGKKWRQFNSDKVCTICFANIQGKQALVDKFRNSQVMEEEEAYRPKIFYSEGPYRGMEEPFPSPTFSRRRVGGYRGGAGADVAYNDFAPSADAKQESDVKKQGGGSFLYTPEK